MMIPRCILSFCIFQISDHHVSLSWGAAQHDVKQEPVGDDVNMRSPIGWMILWMISWVILQMILQTKLLLMMVILCLISLNHRCFWHDAFLNCCLSHSRGWELSHKKIDPFSAHSGWVNIVAKNGMGWVYYGLHYYDRLCLLPTSTNDLSTCPTMWMIDDRVPVGSHAPSAVPFSPSGPKSTCTVG